MPCSPIPLSIPAPECVGQARPFGKRGPRCRLPSCSACLCRYLVIRTRPSSLARILGPSLFFPQVGGSPDAPTVARALLLHRFPPTCDARGGSGTTPAGD